MRIELRGKLVQIAICAGFKLLLQLLDCGTGRGKNVQGSLFLLQRGGQRLLQRVGLLLQLADLLLGGSFVRERERLLELVDLIGKGLVLCLQNADPLIRVVPVVLCRFQRVLFFGDLLVQIRLAADILFCCLDFFI